MKVCRTRQNFIYFDSKFQHYETIGILNLNKKYYFGIE